MTVKKTTSAIKAVRKGMLKALETASNKVLAIYPEAEADPEIGADAAARLRERIHAVTGMNLSVVPGFS